MGSRPVDPKIAWEAALVSNTSDLLLYPAVYIGLTMVLSVTRAVELAGNDWSQTAAFVGAALYTSGGVYGRATIYKRIEWHHCMAVGNLAR